MNEHACTCEHPKQEPGYFCGPNCGAHIGTRHPKWKPVPPGTVIPAGQPYAIRYADDMEIRWAEYVARHEFQSGSAYEWFINSSWKPPLVLPTEPGSVIEARCGGESRKWFLMRDGWLSTDNFGVASDESLRDVTVLFDAGAAR